MFDTAQAVAGYHLNQFCASLKSAENRERFLGDERTYLDEWDMTEEQKQGVLDRDLNRLLAPGGNIYFLAKIGVSEGKNYVQIVSSMTENDAEGHAAMMVNGGRSPEGNRYFTNRTTDHERVDYGSDVHQPCARHRRGNRLGQDR